MRWGATPGLSSENNGAEFPRHSIRERFLSDSGFQALFQKGWVRAQFPVHRLHPHIEEADTFCSSPSLQRCRAEEFQGGADAVAEAGDRGAFGLFNRRAPTFSGSSGS